MCVSAQASSAPSTFKRRPGKIRPRVCRKLGAGSPLDRRQTMCYEEANQEGKWRGNRCSGLRHEGLRHSGFVLKAFHVVLTASWAR